MTKRKVDGRGRNTLHPTSKTLKVSIKIPRVLWRQFDAKAKSKGKSKAEFIRLMIERIMK